MGSFIHGFIHVVYTPMRQMYEMLQQERLVPGALSIIIRKRF